MTTSTVFDGDAMSRGSVQNAPDDNPDYQAQASRPAEASSSKGTSGKGAAPGPRQAFLLLSVEEFAEEDVATILNVDRDTLRHLIEESGRELASQIATDILIIKDEPLIAPDLEGLVESLGHRTIGIARTRLAAVALSKATRPGLILADIQLADGNSGLDEVNDLLGVFEVPVIFITAYLERFLTGERPEPAFLVAKPYQQVAMA